MNSLFNEMQDVLSFAQKKGATDVDIKISHSESFSFGCRLGKAETMERAEEFSVTVRLFQGRKKQILRSSSLEMSLLKQDVEQALSTMPELPEDPYCGLALRDQIANDYPLIDICDPNPPTETQVMERVLEAEEEALCVSGITNSEGGSGHLSKDRFLMLSSNGFQGEYETTDTSFYVEPVTGEGDQMQVSHDSTVAVYFSDLKSAKKVGQRAAEKALAKKNPQKIKTGQYPVVYDHNISSHFLSLFLEAIHGSNLAKGISFLKDKKGQAVFSDQITIVDKPFLPRGLGSKPFDGEGMALSDLFFVQEGVLQHWLMDLVSSRKMNYQDSAKTPLRGAGGKTNLYMQKGDVSVKDLLADIKEGFYVTELMSYPDSLANGDYSVGASGFLIEKGKITKPIHEATVSGQLLDMFRHMIPADDLILDSSVKAPSLFVPRVTVAGS